MNAIAAFAPLGALILVALLYMRRVSEGAAPLHWGAAWLALYAAGLLATGGALAGWMLALVNVLTGLFCGLQLSGALAYRHGARGPRWPLLTGVGIGSLSALLLYAGAPRAAWSIAHLEVALLAAAAVVMWRAPIARGLAHPERLVAVLLGLLAALDAVDPSLRALGVSATVLVLPWAAGAFALALAQILSFVELARERERRLRRETDILRGVTRVAATGADVPSLLRAFFESRQPGLGFETCGAWLLSDAGGLLELAARAPHLADAPGTLRRLPADDPLVRAALAADRPARIEDLDPDRQRVEAWRAWSGLGPLALVALRWRDRPLGLLAGGVAQGRSLGDADRRFFGALADELALSIVHVRAIEDQAEQARRLAIERRTLRALVDNMPAGILLTDSEGRIRMQNRLGAEQWRIDAPEALVGLPARDFAPLVASRLEAGKDRFEQAVARATREREAAVDPFEVRTGGRTLEVSSHPVIASFGDRLGALWISRDVTEARHLEQQFLRAQRMETLGRLAGGVAHDFNNQLTAIVGNARIVLESLAADDARRQLLLDLEGAAEHCAELTRGLLTFARRTPYEPRALDVEKALREVETVIRPSLPPDVQIELHVDPDVRPVFADASQLRRALTNLAVNARDAVRSSGTIRLEAHDDPGPAPPGAAASGRVTLIVRDDGVGMDATTRERLFDPFFTTKPLGEGTGLGLAIVYGVVEAHGASIEVTSELGHGTEVRLRWPTANPALADPPPGPAPSPAPARCEETILLAEDEPAVRRLVCRTLEDRGYRVLPACDGEEALALMRRHGETIALALVDLSMPRRGGLDVVAELRRLRPALPTLLMSGHLAAGLRDVPPGVRLLAKPFGPDALARSVRQALDAGAMGAASTKNEPPIRTERPR